MTPREEAFIENANLFITMSSLDETRHLTSREKQYVQVSLGTPGSFFIIKETKEGWWRESYDYKSKESAQIED